MTKVVVFGIFDRLTAGHTAFLEQARCFGDELIVLVLEDEFVIKYKGKPSIWSLKKRMDAVRRLPFKPTVYQEDIRENWKSLTTLKPDVIVLSAEQARWRHRLDSLLKKYHLPTRVEVLAAFLLPSVTQWNICPNHEGSDGLRNQFSKTY